MCLSNGNINTTFNPEALPIVVYFGCLLLQALGILCVLNIPSRNWNICK